MSRTRAILVACFVLTLAAGAAAGIVAAKANNPPPPERHGLDRELNLSPEQREQMKGIWSKVMDGRGGGTDRRRELDKKRDQAVRDLLTPEQVTRFEEINQDYQKAYEVLAAERRKSFDDAKDATRKILTPEQRTKYDEMMSKHAEGSRGGGGWGGGPGRGPGPGPGFGPGPGPGPGGPEGPRGRGGPERMDRPPTTAPATRPVS